MEVSQYRISPKQLRRMIILETGSIGCLFVTLWSGERNGILTVMMAVIGSLVYGGILMAIGRADGGYFSMTERSMGGFLGRVIWLIYALRFAIRGAWILAYAEHLIRETLFEGSRFMIIIPLMLVCAYAGLRNLQGRARFVELLFWWVVLPLVLLFLVGLWKADIINVLPKEPIQVRELLVGDYRLMVLFLPLELLLFRMSALEGGNQKAWVAGMKGVLLSGLWLLLVYVVTVGIVGLHWGHRSLLVVTDAMELITIRGGGMERLDILMILFWLVGTVVTLSVYLFQGQQLLRRTFPFGSRYGVATLWMTLAIVAIYFSFESAQEWTDWYLRYACVIDFPISIVLPLIIWIVYRFRSRHERRLRQNKEQAVKVFTGCLLLVVTLFGLTGCSQQASLEDRTYVEEIHISPIMGGYEYRCTLAYMDKQSMDTLGKGENTGGTLEQGSGQDKSQSGSQGNEQSSGQNSAQGNGQETTSGKASEEYTATAEEIDDFNREYTRVTGSVLEYSHLQGIYLAENLYQPEAAEDVLEDIREETQAVLSTPIYQEGLEIGEQKKETLGDWLREIQSSIV